MSFADELPSVKMLLVILCGLSVFGILLVNRGIQLILRSIDSLRESLVEEMLDATHEAIREEARLRQASADLAAINPEENLLSRVDENRTAKGRGFVFTMDNDTAALLENAKPGSTLGWRRAGIGGNEKP
jgi:hypothetical protein